MAIDLNGSTGISIDDNEKINIGNDSDLQIYHDGSGFNQIIAVNDHPIQIKTSSENMIKAIPNGAIELYHDNSKKIETSSSGVTVTGTVAATSYTGDGSNLTGVSPPTSFGAVGTYAIAHASGTASENATGIAHNGTVAGSRLVSSGKSTQVNQNPLGASNGTAAHELDLNASGTWRNMSGGVRGSYDFYTYSSLWVRIS